jgi:phage tail sheath protein FI
MSTINESALATPGVYVTEIDSFPPSVAQVATAIPVFIGYTQIATDVNGKNVINQTVHISSLVEYIKYFGTGPYEEANVDLTALNVVDSVTTVAVIDAASASPITISAAFQMFNSIQLFFSHGGGDCYILSVGTYGDNGTISAAGAIQITDFMPVTPGTLSCFDIIQKNADITLIVVTDAVMFDNPNDFNNLMTSALNLCGKLQDRFTIMDVYNGYEDRTYDNNDVITNFRTGIGSSNLNYGAAYYPWLNTSLTTSFSYQNINLTRGGASAAITEIVPNNNYANQIGLTTADLANVKSILVDGSGTPIPNLTMPLINNEADLKTFIDNIYSYIETFIGVPTAIVFTDNTAATQNGLFTSGIYKKYTAKSVSPSPSTPLETLMEQIIKINTLYPAGVVDNTVYDFVVTGGYSNLPATVPNPYTGLTAATPVATILATILPTLAAIFNGVTGLVGNFINDVTDLKNNIEVQLTATSPVYASIITAANASVLVPPSGAIAGVYASTDATRGVWKAPANVSLNTVISPAVNIDDDMQGDLNIDANAGKSINAIRAFTGKGILVWGARTLAGNDNNWRYVPVRRFFIMVEESVKLAAFQFVFEPNVATTWLRVRAMIENYLTGLWRLGAITGSKPEQGFYVKVGLGQTMTQDDILNGKLIVEIGIAPVRPAEFIILRFTQTQQQS